ncbi:hypothetical protein F7725_024428 [Dissostichus mawsoni]|uniref:Uncharacterized protein n=1 Tax=Dissostichus mawsoni TaxID=36200 RepID=A0A7J5Y1C2_DISMA|nr:hypothetical protein F7725_024428 [Dissostichus mawsoni]
MQEVVGPRLSSGCREITGVSTGNTAACSHTVLST